MDFNGKLAVVTGGGSGMGRELVRQLIGEGCSVATCDVSAQALAETREICERDAPQGTKVMTFVADVTDEASIETFRDATMDFFDTNHIHLLFNNAGVGGGGDFVDGDREQWERTFNICWGGVYHCTRVFMPLLVAADQGHIVNTSSVCGFWASVMPGQSNTAYAAAKFAVKGFSEALITDLRLNASHVKCSVVMPGHIGTPIFNNSVQILSGETNERVAAYADAFVERAPTSAIQAATIILDGVKAGAWRILVGDDAGVLDAMVRENPEAAYEQDFYDRFIADSDWRV